MTIGDVQLRISQLQSFMTTAALSSTTSAARTGRAASVNDAAGVSATSAAQFAAALDKAVAADNTGPDQVPSSGWIAPTQGTVTSEFGPRWGRRHEGIDIAAGVGTPVKAAADGVVRQASWNGGYGNAVVIDHGNGVTTLYAHNSELTVKPGDRVTSGQTVAKVGSTGDSTGPHLHFEVKVDGTKIDPRPWLKQRGVTL